MENNHFYMKKYFFLSLLVALSIFAGGYYFYFVDRSVTDVTEDSEVEKNYSIDADDRYDEGDMSVYEEVSFQEPVVYDMNDYLGFPEGNTLKTHSVCYDESIGQGYIAGILTSEIAVFKDDKVFDYIDTGMGVGDFELKELYCDDGVAVVVSEDSAVFINGSSLEISDSIKFDKKVFAQSTYMNNSLGLIAFPVPEDKNFVFYDLNTMRKLEAVSIDRAGAFYKSDETMLFVDTVSADNGYEVTILDKDLTEIDSYLLPSEFPVIDMDYDGLQNDLWVLSTAGKILIFDLDNYTEKPFVVESGVPDPNAILIDPEYTVVMTENGYDYDGYGDFLGGIAILDTKKHEVLNVVKIPTHHTSVELDYGANMAYVTNNGDNSVSRVNLETAEIEAVIEAGSSVEGGIVYDDGSLYLRDRLGGNNIMHFDPATGIFNSIECDYPWPVGIAYSSNLAKIFTFDFLNSSISVIDPEVDQIEATYDFPVPDGSTDGIGDMAYDYTRDIAYTAIPEQNVVLAVDMVSGETIKVIQVEDYLDGGNYADVGGPGVLIVATYEPTAKLFVYANKVSKIYVYDGLTGFTLINTIDVGDITRDTKNFPYSLVVDQMYDRIYIGSKIYDAETYAFIGELSYGNSVALADWDSGLLFTVGVNDKQDDQETLYALNYNGDLIDEIDLSSSQYVKPRFAYDEQGGFVYALYMVGSEVWQIGL